MHLVILITRIFISNEILDLKMTAAANSNIIVLQRWQYLMTIIFAMNNKIAKKMQVTHGTVLADAHVHFLSLAFHSFHLNLPLLLCHLHNITTKFIPSEKEYIIIISLWQAIQNISSLSSKRKVSIIKKYCIPVCLESQIQKQNKIHHGWITKA